MSTPAKQFAATPEAASETITEEQIALLVDTFYARARQDEMLGPVFAGAVHSWEAHLSLLRDFWSSVLLTSGRYKGHLMLAHFQLHLKPAHFARWIEIFRATANDVLPEPAAQLAIQKAEGLATNMQRGLQIYGMLDESSEA